MWITFTIYLLIVSFIVIESAYPHQFPINRCSEKLETSLDSIFKGVQGRSGDYKDPLNLSSYKIQEKLSNEYYYNSPDQFPDDSDDPAKQKITSDSIVNRNVEVAELRVRLPKNTHWVQVDKCQFIPENRTLETRLMFPDLTISGTVLVQPEGGKCNMILRLRNVGIEFLTTPIGGDVHRYSNNIGIMNPVLLQPPKIRTDSYFTEPGFMSVFAHGCRGPTGIRYRYNSKPSKFFNELNPTEVYPRPKRIDRQMSTNEFKHRYSESDLPFVWSSRRNKQQNVNDNDNNGNDVNQDVFKLSSLDLLDETVDNEDYGYNSYETPTSRTFLEYFRRKLFPINRYKHRYTNKWEQIQQSTESMANDGGGFVADSFSMELENIFSKGVRTLLTSYMQKALQPAIKNTLMENMGYTISYG